MNSWIPNILLIAKDRIRQAIEFLKCKFQIPALASLFAGYTSISVFFYAYHEWHLPWHYIFFLCCFAVLFHSLLFLGIIWIAYQYWKETYHPLYELTAFFGLVVALFFTELLQARLGKLILVSLILLFLLLRVVRQKVLCRILIISISVLTSGLLSFQALQKGEILASYYLYKNKYTFEELDFKKWVIGSEKDFWNPVLEIGFQISPSGSYFFTPEVLDIKERTGIGQLVGVLSSSENDPNRYPSIRIFYFPSFVHFGPNEAKKEMQEYLRALVSKREMEDLQEIVSEENQSYILDSKFWTFYDILRPRYAKTGYILLENRNHDSILLMITENLVKGEKHEDPIQIFLDSIRFSNASQGKE